MAEKRVKPSGRSHSARGTLPRNRPSRLGRPRAGHAKPAAARPGSPTPPAKRRAKEPGLGMPTGTELVTTSVRAVGELARVGVTVGGQMLKRAVHRLPRP
jgi:hypothetical protein